VRLLEHAAKDEGRTVEGKQMTDIKLPPLPDIDRWVPAYWAGFADMSDLQAGEEMMEQQEPMAQKYEVTLKQLREAGACYTGYNKVVRSLQAKEFTAEDEQRESYIRLAHKESIPLPFIVESNGLYDAIWCLRCIPDCERDARLFAVWCARQVQHLMTDERSIAALDVAERFANGAATGEELAAARYAAWDAARDAAWVAASAAAWYAASAAAWAAAWAAASAAAWADQKEMFIKMCNGEAPWQKGENV
jgi:hypothetical protein